MDYEEIRLRSQIRKDYEEIRLRSQIRKDYEEVVISLFFYHTKSLAIELGRATRILNAPTE